ncbi:MAG TPA: phage holin family protein [Candidatus Limnocylindrales bacterium]|nr:phage holin family protein [Candidatus Limnocylindrales bacterium]
MAENKISRAESGFDLGQLIQKLFQDLSRLMQNEVQLLKIELEEDVSKLMRGSILLIIGAVFGFFAFGVLTVTLIALLMKVLHSLIWSSLIVGMVYLIIGYILIEIGKTKARQATPVLNESIKELQKDKDVIGKEL